MKRLGLIAGRGRFPLFFAQEARKSGVEVIACAIYGNTLKNLKKYVDRIFWVRHFEFSKFLELFKKENIKEIAMAGQVNPANLFNRSLDLDEDLRNLFAKIKDRKADTIFKAIAEKIEAEGMSLIDSTTYLKDFLIPKGVLTKREPSKREWEDIYFGFGLIKTVANLDIGQTIVVKGKAVLAVEAMEGTDRTIIRGGMIARDGAVVIKVSRPNQDMRFDVPVAGLRTIISLVKSKASCMAIEANKTLFFDKEKCIKTADKNGISLIAV